MHPNKDPGRILKIINERFSQNGNRHFARFGLTVAQFDILGELWSAPEHKLTFKEQEQRLHIAQSTTFCTVTRLAKKGFVRKLDDPTDKRVKYVQLKEKGSSICARFFSDKEEQQRIQNLGLTPEELSQLNMLLEKVLKHLDAINE